MRQSQTIGKPVCEGVTKVQKREENGVRREIESFWLCDPEVWAESRMSIAVPLRRGVRRY